MVSAGGNWSARHLEKLLAQVRQTSVDGSGYPAFVKKELQQYLQCDMLVNGFARLCNI